MIRLVEISKTYFSKNGQKIDALKNISLTFPNAGLVSIIGKSGCGKTTLLNMIGVLDRPDCGKIIVDGFREQPQNIVSYSERELDEFRNLFLGYVFQEYYLIEEWTVWQNIELVLKQQKSNGCEEENSEKKIQKILEYVGLLGCENRLINELSGGQQQRVSIARALVKDPKIIVADEPTGNLDSETSRSIIDLLKRVSETCLVIMVTHDSEVAAEYSDRIIKLSDGCVVLDETTKETKGKAMEPLKEKKAVALPGKLLLSMAVVGLKIKKWRLLISAIVLIVLFSALEILSVYQASSFGKSIETLVQESGTELLYTRIDSVVGGNKYPLAQVEIANSNSLKKTLRAEFGREECFPVIREVTVSNSDGNSAFGNIVIGGKAEKRFELLGRMPKTADEIVLTDCIEAELGFSTGASINTYVTLLNRKMKVCGVVVVGYYEFFSNTEEKSNLEISRGNYDFLVSGRRILVNEIFENEYVNSDILWIGRGYPTYEKGIKGTDGRCCVGSVTALNGGEYAVVDGRLPENDNEILVSRNLATYLLIDSEWDDGMQDFRFADIHNEECGDAFSGYVSMYDSVPNLRIVGVFEENNNLVDVLVAEEKFKQLQSEYAKDCYYDALEVYMTDKNRKEESFDILYGDGIQIDVYCSEKVYQYYNDKLRESSVFDSEKHIISAIIVLLLILFFAFNAKDNHARIGIMRALGVKRKDIAKSMIIEGIVLSGVTIVVSLGVLFGWFLWINGANTIDFGVTFNLLNMKATTVIVPAIVFVFGMMIAIACPIYIMTGRKPIEIIHDL